MLVICNGMIRSGSTLQYNIVKDIFRHENVNFKTLGFFNLEAIENDIDSLTKYSKSDEIIYLIKSHEFSKLNELPNTFIIYSHRNLMDIAGSLKRKFGRKNEELLIGLEKGMNEYKKIVTSKTLLVQDYDKLLDSLEVCIKEIYTFLDLDGDQKIIESIVKNNSAENIIKIQNKNQFLKRIKDSLLEGMLSLNKNIKIVFLFVLGRNLVNKIKFKLFPHDKDSLLHLNHISKDLGKNGKWIEILDNEEMLLIKNNFKNWTELDNELNIKVNI
ncbi:hypothetical protein [uncultured Algibacter sp.]|uniref:hypothetical protein n=1 Tax=uncultured Algibacter sp. TaxID=298659 RepID=UPI00262F7720|nr:hypothetical protein [uncultured Algibacter sp.]